MDPDTQALHLAHQRNQRKIWVCLAIMTGCLSGLLLHLIWTPNAHDAQTLAAYGALAVVALVAGWFTDRLAKEIIALRRTLDGERDS